MNMMIKSAFFLLAILCSVSSYAMTANQVTFKSVKFNYSEPTIAQCTKMGYKMPTLQEVKTDVYLNDIKDYYKPFTRYDVKVAEIEPKWINDKIRYALTGDDSPDYRNFRNKMIADNCESIDDGNRVFGERYVERVPDYKNIVQFKVVIGSQGYNDKLENIENYKLFDMDLNTEIKSSQILDVYRFKEIVLDTAKRTINYDNDTFYDVYQYYFDDEWNSLDELNVFFTKNGISVVIPAMAGYLGSPEKLTVPYSALSGIVKKQYLPN